MRHPLGRSDFYFHQSRPDGSCTIPAWSMAPSWSETADPRILRSGAISASGTMTKARSKIRGCGISSPGSRMNRSPNARMSMSTMRGPQRSRRSRFSARSASRQSASRRAAHGRTDFGGRVEEVRLIGLAPGRRPVERRNGNDARAGIGIEDAQRRRHRRCRVAEIAPQAQENPVVIAARQPSPRHDRARRRPAHWACAR